MTVSVDPDNRRNSHHVKLSKSGTDVGLVLTNLRGEEDPFQIYPEPNPRMPLRTSSGETEYGDINPHLTGFAQKSFSAGRGYRDFDEQRAGYADAHQADTTKEGTALPTGQYFYANPATIRNWDGNWVRHDSGAEVQWGTASCGTWSNFELATKFKASATYNVAFLEVGIAAFTTGTIVVRLRDDNAGSPGTIQASANISPSDLDDNRFITHIRKAVTPYEITSGVDYWVSVYLPGDGSVFHANEITGVTSKASVEGGAWGSNNNDLMFRVTDADKPFKALFQDFKSCLYTVLSYFDNSAPMVFANGYQGVALATSTSTQIDVTGTPFVADEHIGAICVIWGGTGSDQYRPWRKIMDNTTSALLFTGDAWDITPDITSVISIISSEKFVEVTGHGLTTAPRDFLSTHQLMYIAMGSAVNMKQLRRYNNAGTYTDAWRDESTHKADLLFPITSAGYTEIWKALRSDVVIEAAKATGDAGTGWTQYLVFNTPSDTYIGSTDTKINSLGVYGDTPHLWVFKEDIPYEIVNDKPYEFRSAQMKAMRDWRNGKANIQHDRNLYFGFREGCERWSESGDLLHMGPDVRGPEGMPNDRRGYFSSFVGYGGLVIGAYDGGDNNYSSILAWNGEGWHELFRAPWKGARILSIKTQSGEGSAVDRLWFSCGSDVMCIPISENPEQHSDETYNFYPFTWAETIENGWIYYNIREEEKYFDSIKMIVRENNAAASTSVKIEYKIDDDTTWTELDWLAGIDLDNNKNLSSTNTLTGRRIKLRFVLRNYNNRYPTQWLGWVLNLSFSLDQKYIYRVRFRIKDNDVDLNQIADDYDSGLDKLSQLKTWANEKSPIKINSYDPSFDDVYGLIDYPSLRTVAVIKDEGRITRVCELSIKEI